MTIEQLYQLYLKHPFIETDTRKIKKGSIFFALKGANFNGNAFAAQALEAGAEYVVVDEAAVVRGERYVLVDDVLKALQDLAKFHRMQFSIPFLAITGSNGKTTTKELIHSVLSTTYTTYTTEGNLNNHIGIPLTILKIKKDAALAVIEMGANHQKEIEGYCKYTMPTHGLINNCGKAHLEGFGGVEGVKKGKGELFDYLRNNGGTAFIMQDYLYLQEMSKGIREIIRYGTSEGMVTGITKKSEPFIQVAFTNGIKGSIDTRLVGEYNLPNILAAVAVGIYFKVPEAKIKEAIEKYTPSNSRSQLLIKSSNKIILDAYNANPSSMKAAIENLARLSDPNKVLILGAMAELGAESLPEHAAIVDLINKYKWKQVVLVGGDFQKINHPYLKYDNAIDAKSWFLSQQFENTTILIKGSRSMQMEKVLQPG